MEINTSNIDKFKKDLLKELTGLAKKYEIEMETGGTVYDENHFQLKLIIKNKNKDIEEWKNKAPLFGLPTSLFGKEVEIEEGKGFKTYKIVGIEHKRKVFILIEKNGTKYKIDLLSFKRTLRDKNLLNNK